MDVLETAVDHLKREIITNELHLTRSRSKLLSRVRFEEDFRQGESYWFDLKRNQFLGLIDDLVDSVGEIQPIGTYVEKSEEFLWAWNNEGIALGSSQDIRHKIESISGLVALVDHRALEGPFEFFDDLSNYIAVSAGFLGAYPLFQERRIIFAAITLEPTVQLVPRDHAPEFSGNRSRLCSWCNLCGTSAFDVKGDLVHCGELADVCKQCAVDQSELKEEMSEIFSEEFSENLNRGVPLDNDEFPPCLCCGLKPRGRTIYTSGTSLCSKCSKSIRQG